jgi:hypothetical protein
LADDSGSPHFCAVLSHALCAAFVLAQTPTPAAEDGSSELLNLARKIDQQNIKIDLLSQQILRLQQEIENPKNAGTETVPRATQVTSPVPPSNGNTHVVAKGRNAHFHRSPAQSDGGRAAKTQSHRGRPEVADRPDTDHPERAWRRGLTFSERDRA